MLRDSLSGIITFRPSQYTIENMRKGWGRPLYWVDGSRVKPEELVIGQTYLFDEETRSIVEA